MMDSNQIIFQEKSDVISPEMEGTLRSPHNSTKFMKNRIEKYTLLYQSNQFFLETPIQLRTKYQLEQSEVYKLIEAVQAVCELYTIFGLPSPQSQAWMHQHRGKLRSPLIKLTQQRVNHVFYKTVHLLLKFVSANGTGSWVKLLKWKFASFFAFHNEQELPPRPDMDYGLNKSDGKYNCFFSPSVILGGIAHDYLNSCNESTFQQFCDSSQQYKKAMPDVPVSLVTAAENETRIELTRIPEESVCPLIVLENIKVVKPGNIYSYPRRVLNGTRARLELELRRTVSELFDGECITLDELYEPFCPSTSANYIRSRMDLGCIGHLYDRGIFGRSGDCLDMGVSAMPLSDRVEVKFGLNGKHEKYEIMKENQLWPEQSELCTVLEVDVSPLKAEWKMIYLKIFSIAVSKEKPYVTALGLPEPLKVRVISKGPPMLYTSLKPFQAWMWRVLKKNSVFSLIGRYVTEDDVNRCLGVLDDHEEACSGDYVASTNKIRSWVSEVILDQLMIELGEAMPLSMLLELPADFMKNLKTLFLNGLTKHVFVTGEKVMRDVKKNGIDGPGYSYDVACSYFPQTEGQLMGSIISFPFLCIANATLCRLSLEESDLEERKFRLSDKPYKNSGSIARLLINGDDCLSRGTTQRYKAVWDSYGSCMGLRSSVGKTYFSRKFCTINSTIFGWCEKTHTWIERKYVNLGLMMGRKRMGAGGKAGFSPQVGVNQLGTICRELKRSCPSNLWPVVKKRFIYYNSKELNRYPGLSWFLPEWLGGLGLPMDDPKEISTLDRKCATIIKMMMRKDKNLKPCKPKEAAQWLMHQRVMKDLKPYNMNEAHFRRGFNPATQSNFNLEDEWSRVYKYMTVNLLMKEDIEDIHQYFDEDVSCHKSLLHNVNVMSRARKFLENATTHVEPMNDEDMLYESKDLVIATCVSEDFKIRFSELLTIKETPLDGADKTA